MNYKNIAVISHFTINLFILFKNFDLSESVDSNMDKIIENVKKNIKKIIKGKDNVIDLVLTGLLAGGHVLLEDLPGTGKTQLAKATAKTVGASFKRIQFTPDLLPSDVCGINYFNRKDSEFSFKKGAVFTNILLADEINRATPRTQSALLECMEECQVSVDGVTYKLEEPFFVIATQNPIETAGTFPLPEAQLDRFMLKLSMGYPDMESEKDIINTYINNTSAEIIEESCTKEDILSIRSKIKNVFIHDSLKQYILDIADKTRNDSRIEAGVSTRGVLAMVNAARAYAYVCGREYVVLDDIHYLSEFVFAHRLKTSFESDEDAKKILSSLLSAISAPTENWER